MSANEEAQQVINTFKQMQSECKAIASKIGELNMDKEEHRLVIDTLAKLEGGRKAYRLIGGVLVEKTVGDVLPSVSTNYEGIKEICSTLENTLKNKDAEQRAFKEKHQIMTQEERERAMKAAKQ